MRNGKRVVVVVPAFEEAPRIGRVIATMPKFVDRIVVVDDASGDATSARAEELAARDARVVVLRHAENRGVGAAIVTGYRWALAEGANAGYGSAAAASVKADAGDANFARIADVASVVTSANDAFAVMAGDGQMDAADLAAVVDPVLRGEHGYVKGNRFRCEGTLRAMPFARRLGGEVFSRLTSMAIGVRIEDSQCGFTAISRAACTEVDLGNLWPRFGYPNDLLGQLARRGVAIGEVPVRAIYADEQSKLRARHTIRIAALVASAYVRRRRSEGNGAWAAVLRRREG